MVMIMHGNKKIILGVAINDADYVVCGIFKGKRVTCPFYSTWKSMLNRCYGIKYISRKPSYKDCQVCREWLLFSNFKAWMEKQDWQGKELDKDLITKGNRIYSEKNCAFISKCLNNFIVEGGIKRGNFLLGVTWHRRNGSFQAQCRNPITKKCDYLGQHKTQESAHLAWKRRKHELALQLAEMQADPRVANALRTRYL